MSDSLQLHRPLYTRLLCPLLSPRVFSNSCPWSRSMLSVSFSAAPFSFCLQSFQASRSFPVSQLFASGGQIIGGSTSATVLPVNIQSWFPLRLTGFIFQSKWLSRVYSSTKIQKHQFFGSQFSLWTKSHIYIWLLGKIIALAIQTFVHITFI